MKLAVLFFSTLLSFAVQAESIWTPETVPTVKATSDTGAVNLGVKFQSNVAGTITAVRFYRGYATGAGYRAYLWESDGTLLAEANVVEGQCAVPCWQTVQFYPAVEIEANTTYIASYFASAGRYAIDSDYFATSGVTNGPLTALKSVTGDGNGVYVYGQAGQFPMSTWRASNYWVDVVFEPSESPPVTTGLEVIYTPDAPSAATYSQGIAYKDFVFVAGQLPKYPNGTNETGAFAAQANRVMSNIGAILTAAGLTFCDVAKVNVLLTNISDLAEFNTIYVPYFAGCQTADGTPVIPARESMGGIELSGSPDFKLEVSAVACR